MFSNLFLFLINLGVHNSLMALCAGVIPRGVQGTISGAGFEPRSAALKASTLLTILSLQASRFLFCLLPHLIFGSHPMVLTGYFWLSAWRLLLVSTVLGDHIASIDLTHTIHVYDGPLNHVPASNTV